VIVTHPITSIAGASVSKDDPMSVVQQRYNKVEITLPPNIAFELTGHAFSVIEAARPQWELMTGDLSAKVTSSKAAVMKAADVKSDEVMQHMLPIHPMAALVLKNIASAFQSNQRSMFDFIKTPKDLDVHAFQWFIQNTSPISDRPLLTIDMLWDFFYGKGQNGLNDDVRVILDSYGLLKSDKLSTDEQRVLKTVLLFQAISMRVGDVELLKPNEQNVDLAFSGTGWSKGKGRSIAEKLVREGLLFKKPVGGGKSEYTVANSTGDAATIKKKKEEVIRDTKTQDLLIQADLLSAILLPQPIAGRFIMEASATKNFASVLGKMQIKDVPDRFKVIVTFALNDDEFERFAKTAIERTKQTIALDGVNNYSDVNEVNEDGEFGEE
jgi:hypothetical protein